jgi:hypothetical protein
MPLYKHCGRWKNFDSIFEFSVKGYVRNAINLSWDKILLTSVIGSGRHLQVTSNKNLSNPRVFPKPGSLPTEGEILLVQPLAQ